MFKSVTNGDIDMDEIIINVANVGRSKGLNAAHMSKIWRISLKAAKQSLNVTIQNINITNNPTL